MVTAPTAIIAPIQDINFANSGNSSNNGSGNITNSNDGSENVTSSNDKGGGGGFGDSSGVLSPNDVPEYRMPEQPQTTGK